MPLETGNRIEDLVTSNPAGTDDVNQGDDHLRLIKTCIQGSFPSLGPDQVNRTAQELNAVTSKLVSFNGRTDTAAVPADDDYSATGEGDGAGIAKLADFDTGWSSGDFAQWDGDKFVPVTSGSTAAVFHARNDQGHGSGSGVEAIYWNVIYTDDVDGVYGTTDNSAADGWSFTATADLDVTLHCETTPGLNSQADMGATLNGVNTNDYGATPAIDRLAGYFQLSSLGIYPFTASFTMQSGDVVRIVKHLSQPTSDGFMRMTVRPIS